MEGWKYIGMIKDRIRVYQRKNGEYVVSREDDIEHLPTGEELEEIHLTYGSKEVKGGEGIKELNVLTQNEVERQAKEIKGLRMAAHTRERNIESMQNALKARDELCNHLIDDLVQEKKVNLRWEKFAHDAMAQQAALLAQLEAAGIGHGKED